MSGNLPSLKLTAKAPEFRQSAAKRNESSSYDLNFEQVVLYQEGYKPDKWRKINGSRSLPFSRTYVGPGVFCGGPYLGTEITSIIWRGVLNEPGNSL